MGSDSLEFDDERYDDDWSSGDTVTPSVTGHRMPAWRRIDELREQRELNAQLREFYDE